MKVVLDNVNKVQDFVNCLSLYSFIIPFYKEG